MKYLKRFWLWLGEMTNIAPLYNWALLLFCIIIFFFGFYTHQAFSSTSKNHWYFTTKVYPQLRKSECGKCEKLCHFDPHDSGGLTCVGISVKHNPEWFVKELNTFYKSCKPHPGGQMIICNTKLLEVAAKDLYWEKYAKPFRQCEKKAFILAVDSSVLEGIGKAKYHIKNAGGCDNNFDAVKFTQSRIKRFKTLTKCPRYCNGWIKRAKAKLKLFQKN